MTQETSQVDVNDWKVLAGRNTWSHSFWTKFQICEGEIFVGMSLSPQPHQCAYSTAYSDIHETAFEACSGVSGAGYGTPFQSTLCMMEMVIASHEWFFTPVLCYNIGKGGGGEALFLFCVATQKEKKSYSLFHQY